MELVEFVATVVVGFNGFRVSTCYNLNCSGSILICLYFWKTNLNSVVLHISWSNQTLLTLCFDHISGLEHKWTRGFASACCNISSTCQSVCDFSSFSFLLNICWLLFVFLLFSCQNELDSVILIQVYWLSICLPLQLFW